MPININIERLEALRMSRDIIKQGIRDKGNKVSDYAPQEITKTANALLDSSIYGPIIMEEARRLIKQRKNFVKRFAKI